MLALHWSLVGLDVQRHNPVHLQLAGQTRSRQAHFCLQGLAAL